MPIVHVELFGGRSLEQKRELVHGITEVVARTCGVSADGIHVLLNEMSRENWGRGSVVHADRARGGAQSPAMAVGDFVAVTNGVEVVAPDARSNELLGSLVAKGLDGQGDHGISSWSSEEAWRSNGGVESDNVTICDRVELPSGGGLRGRPRLERFMTISTHEVTPSKLEDYLELRRIAVNPGMARLEGFVSSDILRKRAKPTAFFVVNQWLEKQDSDRYTESRLHDYLKSRVRPLLDHHSGGREFAVPTARDWSDR